MTADLWYKNAVIYSLDVETYLDSDGDGTGDFEGLVRRLDYLDALGVDTIWLAPFQPSPDRDDGYDITDYYGVDPRFGSGGDFVEFIREARSRGLRVIADLVVNHTSDEHPWFQEARSDPGSHRRDWYVWSKKKPKFWKQGMVFPGHQDSTWSYDEEAEAYFYHRFYEFMPDLNMKNAEVREEVHRIMGFWLQLGVDGFRVDAVPFLLEQSNPDRQNWDTDYELLYSLRRFLQLRRGDAILLGEANVEPPGQQPYFGERGEGLQMMFNFWVNQHLFYGLASEDVGPLIEALNATRLNVPAAQWAHFLRNHDELDLGRLSDEQRHLVFDRFAPDEGMRLYDRGIRRRLSPMLGDRRRIELAYSVMFSLPGTPVIRYGDELGMGEDLSLEQRSAVRTPMQWSDGPQGGFSTCEDTELPVVDDPVFGYQRVNVEAQRRDPDSQLNWMTNMIRMRKQCPEIGWGDWTILDVGTPGVLAMRYDWRGNSLVTLHNFADRSVTARVDPGVEGAERLADLRIPFESRAGDDRVHEIVLDPYDYRWFRVGGLNHAVSRHRE